MHSYNVFTCNTHRRWTLPRGKRAGRRKQRPIKPIITGVSTTHYPTTSRTIHPNNLITIKPNDVNKNRNTQIKSTDMCVGYVNAQSCRNKTDELKALIEDNDIDIMFVVETWLKPGRDNALINDMTPHGYRTETFPRPKRDGGGMAMIYKECLKGHISSVKTNNNKTSSFELLEVFLIFGDKSFQINCIYRPPYSKKNKSTIASFIEEFELTFTEHFISKSEPLFIGDFNLHYDVKESSGMEKNNAINGPVLHAPNR